MERRAGHSFPAADTTGDAKKVPADGGTTPQGLITSALIRDTIAHRCGPSAKRIYLVATSHDEGE